MKNTEGMIKDFGTGKFLPTWVRAVLASVFAVVLSFVFLVKFSGLEGGFLKITNAYATSIESQLLAIQNSKALIELQADNARRLGVVEKKVNYLEMWVKTSHPKK